MWGTIKHVFVYFPGPLYDNVSFNPQKFGHGLSTAKAIDLKKNKSNGKSFSLQEAQEDVQLKHALSIVDCSFNLVLGQRLKVFFLSIPVLPSLVFTSRVE